MQKQKKKKKKLKGLNLLQDFHRNLYKETTKVKKENYTSAIVFVHVIKCIVSRCS